MARDRTVRFETIGPKEADKLLKKNTTNRSVRKAQVDKYARAMESGEWHRGDTETPISTDAQGQLISGQHRLLAVVQSGAEIDVIRVDGASRHADHDTGIARSLHDYLTYQEEPNPKLLASIIRLSHRWETDNMTGRNPTSHKEHLDWLDANPDVREVISDARAVRKNCGGSFAVLGAFIYRINRIEPEWAYEFVQGMADCSNIRNDDPRAVMVRKFRKSAADRRRGKEIQNPQIWMAMLIKTWNYWLEDRSVTSITWSRGGKKPPKFPILKEPV